MFPIWIMFCSWFNSIPIKSQYGCFTITEVLHQQNGWWSGTRYQSIVDGQGNCKQKAFDFLGFLKIFLIFFIFTDQYSIFGVCTIGNVTEGSLLIWSYWKFCPKTWFDQVCQMYCVCKAHREKYYLFNYFIITYFFKSIENIFFRHLNRA